MPGIDGLGVARRLSQTSPKTRVLFVSGYAEERIRMPSRLDGKVDILAKPFTRAELCPGREPCSTEPDENYPVGGPVVVGDGDDVVATVDVVVGGGVVDVVVDEVAGQFASSADWSTATAVWWWSTSSWSTRMRSTWRSSRWLWAPLDEWEP